MNNRLARMISENKPEQLISILLRLACCQIKHLFNTLTAYWLLRRWGAQIGSHLRVTGRLRCNNRGRMIIGNDVAINSAPDNNYVGGDRRTSFWVAKKASLTIEDCVRISGMTIVAKDSVTIGKNTFLGGGCQIYDTDFHEIDPAQRKNRTGGIKTAPVNIGPDVFVGGFSIILKGVTIGQGAVVGAGSVVTKDIPANEIWAGNPAKFIKKIEA